MIEAFGLIRAKILATKTPDYALTKKLKKAHTKAPTIAPTTKPPKAPTKAPTYADQEACQSSYRGSYHDSYKEANKGPDHEAYQSSDHGSHKEACLSCDQSSRLHVDQEVYQTPHPSSHHDRGCGWWLTADSTQHPIKERTRTKTATEGKMLDEERLGGGRLDGVTVGGAVGRAPHLCHGTERDCPYLE
jgi:hypothetical protein